MTAVILAGILVMMIAGGCASHGNEDRTAKTDEKTIELHILAAASLTDAFEEIAKEYEKMAPDVRIVFNFDSSGTLKTQIEQGAPADLFVSAAMRQMNELDEAGLIKTDTIIKLLENKVVLIKPAGEQTEIASFEDAASDKAEMIAIGNADVPAGQYAEEIYKNLGLWDAVQKKANLATNVRQVLDWVATGNVPCGVVYATDAMIEKDVEIICEAPEGSCEKVIYPAGVVKDSRYPEEAEAFENYLRTEEAEKILKNYGFTIWN